MSIVTLFLKLARQQVAGEEDTQELVASLLSSKKKPPKSDEQSPLIPHSIWSNLRSRLRSPCCSAIDAHRYCLGARDAMSERSSDVRIARYGGCSGNRIRFDSSAPK